MNEPGTMSDLEDKIDRLEARIDHQAARIDALYRALEREGIFPRPETGMPPDASSADAAWEVADVPANRQRTPAPVRRAAGFHLGTATGV
jgi:hypothetical protein